MINLDETVGIIDEASQIILAFIKDNDTVAEENIKLLKTQLEKINQESTKLTQGIQFTEDRLTVLYDVRDDLEETLRLLNFLEKKIFDESILIANIRPEITKLDKYCREINQATRIDKQKEIFGQDILDKVESLYRSSIQIKALAYSCFPDRDYIMVHIKQASESATDLNSQIFAEFKEILRECEKI